MRHGLQAQMDRTLEGQAAALRELEAARAHLVSFSSGCNLFSMQFQVHPG